MGLIHGLGQGISVQVAIRILENLFTFQRTDASSYFTIGLIENDTNPGIHYFSEETCRGNIIKFSPALDRKEKMDPIQF